MKAVSDHAPRGAWKGKSWAGGINQSKEEFPKSPSTQKEMRFLRS